MKTDQYTAFGQQVSRNMKNYDVKIENTKNKINLLRTMLLMPLTPTARIKYERALELALRILASC